jgi:hypothetical protein
MRKLLQLLFCCAHRNVTWPRKRDGRDVSVCLDCGREIVCTLFNGEAA